MARIWRWLGPSLIIILALAWLVQQPPSLARQAAQARLAGKWHQATRLYQQLNKTQPSVPNQLALAELYLTRGEWQAAHNQLIDVFRQPLSLEQHQQTWQFYAWAGLQRGDQASVQAALNSLESMPWGHVLRAEIALRSGDLISATNQLNQAQGLQQPWQNWAWLRSAEMALPTDPQLAQSLVTQIQPQANGLQLANPWQLQQRLQRLNQLVPQTSAQRMLGVAGLWSEQGLWQAADILLSQIPINDSMASFAANQRALLHWSAGDSATALALIEAAQTQWPNVATLPRTQAKIAASSGQPNLALAALQQAVNLEPVSSDNYLVAAAISLSQADFNGTAAAYDQAIATGPMSGTLALEAANFYINTPLRRCSSGLKYARQALNSAVDDLARRVVASVGLQCLLPAEAEHMIAPLYQATPAEPQLAYLYAVARWQQAKPDSQRLLEQAADQAIQTPWLAQLEFYIK
ncbi:tetratricopeptide repeat protein [Herpetosiphon llansteffanensis]